MESTRNRNTELGRPKLPAGSVKVSKTPGPECSVTTGASKSPKENPNRAIMKIKFCGNVTSEA